LSGKTVCIKVRKANIKLVTSVRFFYVFVPVIISACFVERKEALGVLKIILDRCSTENITKVMIMPSASNNSFSTGSQIYIEAAFDIGVKRYIQTIAEQHNLAIKEDINRIIIFKPQQVLNI